MKWWKKYGALAMTGVLLTGACVEAGVWYTSSAVSAEETEETQRVTLNVVGDEDETEENQNSADAVSAADSETVSETVAETEAETEESGRVTLNMGGDSNENVSSAEDSTEAEETEASEDTETSEEADASEDIQLGAGTTVVSVADGTGSIVTTDVSEVVENCMPSIVSVINVSAEETASDSESESSYDYYYYYYYGEDTTTEETEASETETAASGIIIAQSEEELLIVTSYHVVSEATELSVGFSVEAEDEDDLVVSARVKGTNASCDLAVVAVELSDIEDSVLEQLRIANLGSSDDLKVGQAAIALGNVPGYGQSATVGVISVLNCTVTVNDVTMDVILTDAAINTGGCGGALLNSSGEVIGICVADEADGSSDSMGYVIPIDTAIPVLEQLVNKETRDKLSDSERGYIGATVLSVSEEAAETYNMPEGAFVYEVTEGSAAEEAGIQRGDIITAIEGESVTTSTELIEKMSYYAPGETITLEVQTANNGTYEVREVEVTLQEGSSSSESEEDAVQEEQTEEPSMDEGSASGEDERTGNSEGRGSDDFSGDFDDGFSDGFEDYNSQFN